jgi:RNA polymerase sigma-70 factor (ECF subfamily)
MRDRPDTPEQRFDQLYRETSDDVLGYLLRRSRTAEDAADALAETYAAAWRKLDTLPEGDRARLWLFGAARNELRKTATRLQTDQDLASALVRDLRVALEEAPNTADQDDAMRETLGGLSRLDYEIVTLTAWEGLAPREIAAVLALSPNVVRIRLHRARSNLRSLLKRDRRLEATPAPATQHPRG